MSNQSNIEYSNSWATLLYDFENQNFIISDLKKLGLMFVIGPKHDKEDCKTHKHILFMFKSKKSYNQMINLFNKYGLVGAEHVYNVEEYYKYLWHDEETEKPIYNKDDMIFINCSEDNFVNETTIFNNILSIILDENISSMKKLIIYLNSYYFYFDTKIQKVLRNNQMIFRSICNDNKIDNELKEKEQKQ